MTYEFFYKHVSPVLSDAACERLWAKRPERANTDPEDQPTAEALRFVSLLHAMSNPDDLRPREKATVQSEPEPNKEAA